jgi:hypothetical protein
LELNFGGANPLAIKILLFKKKEEESTWLITTNMENFIKRMDQWLHPC